MNSILKIITIFSAFFICSCLNFYTSSSSLNDNEIDKKYIGLYDDNPNKKRAKNQLIYLLN